MLKGYLSGSIISKVQINNICSKFPEEYIDIFLPHTIEETELAHHKLPISIFNKCLKEMLESDFCLLNLDSFGKDSSWECGWFKAHNKPVVGYVSSNLKFLEDWMVKGGLNGVLVDNENIYSEIIKDPILKYKKIDIVSFSKVKLNDFIKKLIKNINEL